ncbi:hypothetical protein ACOMHN_028812 [Nucella lapillus]
MRDLDSSETGTVRRRTKTVVTPKMAMESFRLSFLNDDQDVNFDAILGQLSELENQLTNTQTQLCQSMGGGGPGQGGGAGGAPGTGAPRGSAEGGGFLGSDTIQAELDALAAEITSGLGYRATTNGQLLLPPMPCEQLTSSDGGGETDSAYSDNASLPSSESYTSMATVSSSAETTSSSSGETCSITSAMSSTTLINEEEQLQRLKAEKIRIALEKIKEAKIRKLFVRAWASDGSSKSILVDEKMTVGQVCAMLADKHHGRLNHAMAVVEQMPELFMERILEDHDSLVENMVMWTRDSKNKVLFEERQEKYNLFFQPEGNEEVNGYERSISETGALQRLEHGRDWSMAEIGAWQRLEHGRDWSMAETGAWQRLEHCRDWSTAETGTWQRLEHCRDWSMAETGARQRLEHGRDWSIAETGAWQRLEHGRDWSISETGAWQRLEYFRDWSIAETGVFQRLEHCRDWSISETGAWQRLEYFRDWSMAETEAWQRLEHGRDWSTAETGAWQRLEHGRDWSTAETGALQRLRLEHGRD